MPTNALLTLYSNPTCANSHRVRFLAHEKENLVDVINVFPHDLPQELIDANPYGSLPTLVDRDVILRDAEVMLEYLDERFPSPTLMPVDPISRAKVRMMLVTIRELWLPPFYVLNDLSSSEEDKEKARKALLNNLQELKPIFEYHKYCMSDSFTVVDVSIAPILWRLNHLGISDENMGPHYSKYLNLVFTRKAFTNSLSLFEENMR